MTNMLKRKDRRFLMYLFISLLAYFEMVQYEEPVDTIDYIWTILSMFVFGYSLYKATKLTK